MSSPVDTVLMWDFETDPEYQAKLDWVDEFMRDEVEPLDLAVAGSVRQDATPTMMAILRPLQQQVKTTVCGRRI